MQCPACGSEIEEGMRKCPCCGAIHLGHIGKTDGPLKRKPWLVPFLLGLLFNIAGIIVTYIFYHHARMLYEEDPTKRAVAFSVLGTFFPLIIILHRLSTFSLTQ